eukprot:CAMPEP_0177734922 /NCGR_PEP_ID=MMETSP0484_2-20121128/24499_1 /TAXON_ID=354590 /ORGANISM="Rhodomonas lens, Strain RHODO" /LENGTH=431 /DNA_ID=CAMNT_0019248447 /DNA_START=32 /DNA_END=1327 /DNA_ORIENTATION=+
MPAVLTCLMLAMGSSGVHAATLMRAPRGYPVAASALQLQPVFPPGIENPLFEEPAEKAPEIAQGPVEPNTGDGLEIRDPPLGREPDAASGVVEIAEAMWEEIQRREKELAFSEEELTRKEVEFEEMKRQFEQEMQETGQKNAEQSELLIAAAKEIAEHAKELAEREAELEAAKAALEQGNVEKAGGELDEESQEEAPKEQEEPKEEAPQEEAPQEEAPQEKEAPQEEAAKEEAPKEQAAKEPENAPPTEGVNLNINVNHKASGPVNMNINVETSMEKEEEEDEAKDGMDAAEMKAGDKMLRQLYKKYAPGSKVPGSSKVAQAKHQVHREAMRSTKPVVTAPKAAAKQASPASVSHPVRPTAANKPEGSMDLNFLGFGMKLAANVTWQPGAAAWYAYLPEDDRDSGASTAAPGLLGACAALLVSSALLLDRV